MIRTFKVELNAAHPELPLMEATAIAGSPSAANIVGVPAKVGEWTIDSVFIRVSYPDASTITQEAAKSADGVWTATVPRCDVSGRVKCGFEILASGTDETGAPVSGYVLGIADFAVYTRDLEIKAGEKSVTLRYFDELPASPAPGDVAPSGGVLSLYDGYTWLPFDARAYAAAVAAQNTADAALAQFANYYTAAETDAAIDRLAAYYITYTAAGAAFPTYAALAAAQTVYSGGAVRIPTRNDYAVVAADETHGGAEYRYIYAVADGAASGQWQPQYPIETNDYIALANKPQINGVELVGNTTAARLGLADIDSLRYSLPRPILESATLADRTINYVAPPPDGDWDIILTFPPAVAGFARDFAAYVAPSEDFQGSISFSVPSGASIFGDGFDVEIASGEEWLFSITEIADTVFYVRAIKLN